MSNYFHKTILYVLYVFPFVSFSQVSPEIDSLISKQMREKHIPGLAFAVVKDGQVIQKAVYGFSDVENQIPVTNHSVFEIASMTKQFTCTAILLLEEDKKLSLNDPLSKYISDIPKEWEMMTLYQLMNHTSGLSDDWDKPTSYFLENHTDEKMRLAQQSDKLLFPPGESYHYSSGPFFLGLVIEKITGKHYSRFLQDRIFGPLNMNCTHVYNDSTIVAGRAAGYWWKNGKLQNGVDLPPAAEGRADVGILTCMEDLIKWCQALEGNKVLNAQSLSKFFSFGVLNNGRPVPYSFGWYVFPFRSKILYEHGGAFRTGFNSKILAFPELNVKIVVLCNLWRAGLSSLSYDIAAFHVPGFKMVSPKERMKDNAPQMTLKFEELLKKLADPELNKTVLYREVNFAGFDPGETADMLKGFRSLTLINKQQLDPPMPMYGKQISNILYYKVEANEASTWAFYLTKDNELLLINTE